MPVYLDENDGRKEFIRECIKKDPMVALDSSHFATWIYAGSMGYESSTFDAYADLVGTVASEFPNVEYSEIVQDIQLVINEEEEEYFDAWASYADQIAKLATTIKSVSEKKDTITIDVDSIYDPRYSDC